MVDALVPNRRQVINIHRVVLAMATMSHEPCHITLHPMKKKINYVRDRSDGRQPVGFLVFAEFVLSPGGGGGGGGGGTHYILGNG